MILVPVTKEHIAEGVRLMGREAAKRWRREIYYGDKDAWK